MLPVLRLLLRRHRALLRRALPAGFHPGGVACARGRRGDSILARGELLLLWSMLLRLLLLPLLLSLLVGLAPSSEHLRFTRFLALLWVIFGSVSMVE